MNYLLDTHVLLWASIEEDPPQPGSRLPLEAREIIEDESNTLFFSSMSIWEVVIKSAKQSPLFSYDPHPLRHLLIERGYEELEFNCDDALEIRTLPNIHTDPFDRALIAQAKSHGLTLLTCDKVVAGYGQYPILYFPPNK